MQSLMGRLDGAFVPGVDLYIRYLAVTLGIV